MRINHIGFAVKNIKDAMQHYYDLFHVVSCELEPLTEKSVMKTMMIHTENGVLLELLEPLQDDCAIAGYLKKHGEGMHHIAFEVENIHAEYENAKRQGYRVLGEIEIGAGGMQTFFIHPKDTSGVLMEYVAYTERTV